MKIYINNENIEFIETLNNENMKDNNLYNSQSLKVTDKNHRYLWYPKLKYCYVSEVESRDKQLFYTFYNIDKNINVYDRFTKQTIAFNLRELIETFNLDFVLNDKTDEASAYVLQKNKIKNKK